MNKTYAKVAALRRDRCMSRELLAVKCEVSIGTIIRLENGKTRRPKLRLLRDVAAALLVPVEKLHDGSEA